MHRLDRAEVLIDDRVHHAAAFGDVTLQPADEPRVVVGVDEDLDVHQTAQLLIGEDQDAFDDHDRTRFDHDNVGPAGVAREVVARDVDRPSLAQRRHVLDEEIRFERVGMIVVERGALLEPQPRIVAVILVVLEEADLFGAQAVHDPANDRRLARTGSACDADHEWGH